MKRPDPRLANRGLKTYPTLDFRSACLTSNEQLNPQPDVPASTMESENSIVPPVKCEPEKTSSGKHLPSEKTAKRRQGKIAASDIRDRRTFTNFLRIEGYLNGAFTDRSHGKLQFLDFDVERFHRKTKTRGKRAIAVRTLERVLPQFARWTDSYRMERVNVRGRWVRRFTPRDGVALAIPGATIRDRLQAAIRAYVAKGGRCRVDREFCRRFANLSGLPVVAVESIWLRLPKFAELRGRWRGEGRSRRLVVENPARWAEICAERTARLKSGKYETTDPQTLPPVSISFGNERLKNSGLAPGTEETARATPANEDASDNPERETRPKPEPGGYEHDGNTPADGRARTAFSPLQICGRFVSARKLLNLATWLAGGRLKFAHVNRERVRFLFPHARNFAYRALRFGYAADVIERAYVGGVERSHNDALHADRIGLDAGGFPVFASQRAPSAAVVYAWQILRAGDPREPVELWAEFFNAPRRERDPARPAPKLPAVGKAAVTSAAGAGLLAELREIVARRDRPGRENPGPGDASSVTLGELSAYLAAKHDGLTLAKFAAFPWRVRTGFLARAAAWKKSGGESGVDKPSV